MTKNKIWSRVCLALAAVAALLLAAWGTGSAGASQSAQPKAAVVASQDACHTTNNATPRGNCGPFTQVYADNFNGGNVPVRAFSSCAGDGNFKCAGLKTKYPRYYSTLGAYPVGWTDTAGHNGDGNSGPVPGDYRPDRTMSVVTNGTDGQMRVRMYYANGRNNVAAPVPVKCNFRYGKVTERLIVRGPLSDRFKMAHLRYTPDEIDYPEAGSTFGSDPVMEFTHGFRESSGQAAPHSAWTSWHTYSTEIVPGQVRFYFDGRLFKTVNADYPRSAFWILQNESALGIDHVSGPVSQTIDTTWLTCYKYQP